MSVRYFQFCPVARAAEVLGERWTILIVRELLMGTIHFGGLQRSLSKVSPTLLTKRLNQLQDSGLVVRKTSPDKRRAEYHLTPAGRELGPVVMSLGEWGMKWARGQMCDDELDVEYLMADYSRRIDQEKLPGGLTVIQFSFTGLPKYANWWVVLEADGRRELCVENPHQHVDVRLRSNLRTMVEIWSGDLEIRTALKDGRLLAEGEPHLVRTVSSWLRIGMLAHVRPQAAGTTGEAGKPANAARSARTGA